ncbi:MAG: DUF308 domain-containing protein [Clostridiales bacterium]|nr:DUF308 domain-containing protein [Clostridiales bacterium]
MKKIFASIKKYSLIIAFATMILGILLIAFPDKMLAYASIIVGGVFIACGVLGIINYLRKKDGSFTLTLAVIAVVSGIIICIAYKQIISVIIFFLGIFLLVGGIFNLVNSFYIASSRLRSWVVTVLLSVCSVILGVVSITNPFDTQEKIVQFIGAGLIVFSVLDFIAFIQIKKIQKDIENRIKSIKDENEAVEVEYKDVDD